MPDHVHLLVVASAGMDVMAFMQRFKQVSGFACGRLLCRDGRFWQRSYHDHVLRRDEDVESIRRYIRENPVRAGLAEVPEDYPFSGSLAAEREG
jgi:REP element-mobilizing transposase RayT